MINNLLDCITHGTTHEEFLSTFDSPEEAAAHLREFYINALEEQGADIPDDLDELERNTLTTLKRIARNYDYTRTKRTTRRQQTLDRIAQDAGFESWSAVGTAVKNGKATIVKR